jgi:hypothetical protein
VGEIHNQNKLNDNEKNSSNHSHDPCNYNNFNWKNQRIGINLHPEMLSPATKK